MAKLRVWWIPQIPGSAFTVEVESVMQAHLLVSALADYDRFQFDQHVKPDYSNVGGLVVYDDAEGEWFDWYDEETGEDFDEFRGRVFPEIVTGTGVDT